MAVWIKNGEVCTYGGELGVFEINSDLRWDWVRKKVTRGVGITMISDILSLYHTVSIRPIRKDYSPRICSLVVSYCESMANVQFNNDRVKFLCAWAGVSCPSRDSPDYMFCSELMATFYQHAIGMSISNILCVKSLTPNIAVPHYYSVEASPNSTVFMPYHNEVCYGKESMLKCGGMPVLVILLSLSVIVIIVALVVRANNRYNKRSGGGGAN